MNLLKSQYLFVFVLLLSMVLLFTNIGLANDLIDAVKNNNKGEVKTLIDNGADIDARNEDGGTPLMIASETELAKLLIKNGADVEARENEYGATALMIAAASENNEKNKQAELLINNGADIEARDKNGHTALWYASKKGNTEIVNLIEESL